MQAVSFAGAVVLAPTLALLGGSIVVGMLWCVRFTRGARGVAILACGLALGSAIRLAVLAHASAIDATVAGLPGVDGPTRLAYLDAVAALSLVAILTTGLIILLDPSTGPGAVDSAATLLALGAASVLLITGNVAVVAAAWTLLVFGATADLVARRDLDSAVPWLSLAVAVAPLFLVGGLVRLPLGDEAIAPGVPAVSGGSWSALAVGIIALVSAGLTPLNGWLRHPDRSGLSPLIADGIFPLVGFYLAVRAVSVVTADRSITLAAVLIGVGLWSVGDAFYAAWQAADSLEVARAARRGECGLAFVALGIGTGPSIAAGAFLIAFSVLARLTARVAAPAWLARVGWASAVGLPPLPGIIGRWLIVSAAFVTTLWPFGIAVGVASFVLDVGLLGSAAVYRDDNRSSSVGAGAIAILLVLAGLLPPGWTGPLAPSLDLSGGTPVAPAPLVRLLALVVVLLPPLVASVVVGPRARPRHRQLSRNVQERSWESIERLAQRTAELARVIDARYGLPFGFLAAITIVFAFMR